MEQRVSTRDVARDQMATISLKKWCSKWDAKVLADYRSWCKENCGTTHQPWCDLDARLRMAEREGTKYPLDEVERSRATRGYTRWTTE